MPKYQRFCGDTGVIHPETVPEVICGICSEIFKNKEKFVEHIVPVHPDLKDTTFWADKIMWTMYPETA
jgi:hypothetical protein